MDRKDLRVVRPMHIAETRAEAAAQCREGLQTYLNYMNNISQRYDVPAGEDVVAWWNRNGHGVIGTPDDAIAAIQQIYDTQGEFGCVLNLPNNIADWPQTKRSFELYANHVMPHFRGSNRSRVASRLAAQYSSDGTLSETLLKWALPSAVLVTRAAATLKFGCLETGSHSTIVSSLAARGRPSG